MMTWFGGLHDDWISLVFRGFGGIILHILLVKNVIRSDKTQIKNNTDLIFDPMKTKFKLIIVYLSIILFSVVPEIDNFVFLFISGSMHAGYKFHIVCDKG